MENITELLNGLKEKYIFLENDFPIFFSCTDNAGNDYLGCYAAVESNVIKFLISKVSAVTIFQVLTNRKYLYDAFKESKHNFLVWSSNEAWNAEFKEQVEDNYLPTKNEYLDAEVDEYVDEKDYYASKILNQTINNFIFFASSTLYEKKVSLHSSKKLSGINFDDFNTINENSLGFLGLKQGGFNAKSA